MLGLILNIKNQMKIMTLTSFDKPAVNRENFFLLCQNKLCMPEMKFLAKLHLDLWYNFDRF